MSKQKTTSVENRILRVVGIFLILTVLIVYLSNAISSCGDDSSQVSTYQPPATSPPLTTSSQPSKSERGSALSSKKTTQDGYRIDIRQSGDLTMCQVTFTKMPPTSDAAAKIVRDAVKAQVNKDGSREILAMAFNASGDALPDRQYGGALVYKPSDEKILTMKEREGIQTTSGDEGAYYVEVEDRRTARGLTPVGKWLDVSIVFPSKPSNPVIKEAVLKKIGELKGRGLDVNVYIFTGNKTNKLGWKQIRAANRKYMGVSYVAKTGKTKANWSWAQ